eukprot:2032672-Alexandrium_andersonii.AAC.1
MVEGSTVGLVAGPACPLAPHSAFAPSGQLQPATPWPLSLIRVWDGTLLPSVARVSPPTALPNGS